MSHLITPPAEFPVAWDSPADAELFWLHDRLHFPDPMTPAEFWFMQILDAGFNHALQFYDCPIVVDDRHINTYAYAATLPLALPDADLEEMAHRSEEKLWAAMTELGSLWLEAWLPQIQEHVAFWENFDLRAAELPELRQHLLDTEARLHRMWEIHFLLIIPMMLAISQFDEMVQDLFEEAGALDAYEMLTGFPSKTIESGQMLWALSRKALSVPSVLQVLSESSANEVLGKLATFPEGQAFVQEFDLFLSLHGLRGDKWRLNFPFWIEDPTPVIESLQDYVTQPDRDLDRELEDRAARRERRVAEARTRLQAYPQPVIDEFESLLRAAQVGNTLKEEHSYWLDFKVYYHTRQLLLEMGRRLCATGPFQEPDDVFYLYMDELHDMLGTQPTDANGSAEANWRALIADRKAQEERFARITPPPELGTVPNEPPPDDPVSKMFMKMEGVTPEPSQTPGELLGSAGSPGMAQGVARVLRVLSDGSRLNPGEILVAEATAPPWTPLFATAGAVVTDTGGVLSHSAVIAREYGIPAVVGAGVATTVIQDGQTVEVNGSTGTVRVVNP